MAVLPQRGAKEIERAPRGREPVGAPERARTALAARGTAYLALCPDSNEAARFRSAAPEGFLARLADGEAFDWLQPLAVPASSNLRVWRIVR